MQRTRPTKLVVLTCSKCWFGCAASLNERAGSSHFREPGVTAIRAEWRETWAADFAFMRCEAARPSPAMTWSTPLMMLTPDRSRPWQNKRLTGTNGGAAARLDALSAWEPTGASWKVALACEVCVSVVGRSDPYSNAAPASGQAFFGVEVGLVRVADHREADATRLRGSACMKRAG